jgi:hypothetical protein
MRVRIPPPAPVFLPRPSGENEASLSAARRATLPIWLRLETTFCNTPTQNSVMAIIVIKHRGADVG